MAQYELMVLVAIPTETQKTATVTEMLETVTKKVGATISLKTEMGERQMAYKVGGLSRGYYLVYEVEAPKNKIKELNKLLRLQKDIIRYVLLSEETKK